MTDQNTRQNTSANKADIVLSISRIGYVLTALFLIFCLSLLLLLSAGTYHSILELAKGNDSRLSAMGYIITQIHNHDCAAAVSISGDKLILTEAEEDCIYELCIYASDGMLWERYGISGEEENAELTGIMPCTSLSLCYVREGLMQISVDGRTHYVSVFSEQTEAKR